MSKLDWSKARRHKSAPPIRTQDAADRWLARFDKGPPVRKTPEQRSRRAPSVRGLPRSREICIVIGADRSPTKERQVFIFPNLDAAHRAGFSWAI